MNLKNAEIIAGISYVDTRVPGIKKDDYVHQIKVEYSSKNIYQNEDKEKIDIKMNAYYNTSYDILHNLRYKVMPWL